MGAPVWWQPDRAAVHHLLCITCAHRHKNRPRAALSCPALPGANWQGGDLEGFSTQSAILRTGEIPLCCLVPSTGLGSTEGQEQGNGFCALMAVGMRQAGTGFASLCLLAHWGFNLYSVHNF